MISNSPRIPRSASKFSDCNLKLIWSLALGAWILLGASPAAIDRTQKPSPGPAPEAAFPDYTTKVLPNGLKVFVIQDDRKPSVTFRLLIKGGSSLDGDKPGLSGFVASMLNRGTKTRDATTFAQESDFIGSSVEAASGSDAISIGAGGLTKYTDKILELLVDATLNPTFPGEQFLKEQKKALSGIAAEKQQPQALAAKMATRVVYGPEHPYGRYRTEESVASIARDDLLKYHQTWFAPNNATLAIVGDVQPDEIISRAEKAFSGWQQKDVPPMDFPEPPKMEGLTVHLVDRPGSVQSNIIITHPGPPRKNPDTAEINVMNATLGGGFSGRLFQNLRERHGWTYGAYSAFDLQKLAGDFSANAETRNEVTAPAVQETLAEIKRLQSEPVPDAELELQREYNVGNYLLSLENASRTAQRVQDIELYGLDPDFYKRYAKRMASTTASQVLELARHYLSVENVAIVVVGEAKQIQPELEKIGKVVLYNQDLKPQGDAGNSKAEPPSSK
jgi:predicted Zn-dependent peptidase